MIGQGRYGEAATVSSKLDGKLFVMKKEFLPLDDKDRRRHEVKALKKCDHKNIVKYFEDFYQRDHNNYTWSLIIMEYCHRGINNFGKK